MRRLSLSCCVVPVAVLLSVSALAAPVRTTHELQVGGRRLAYQATTGYLDLMKPSPDGSGTEGQTQSARLFFVAYTLDTPGSRERRPLTFMFNGGPGSPAIWLHMGGLGPRRAALSAAGEAPSPPYELIDNEDTWLQSTDLVFVDPVSTGYSHAAPEEDPAQFYGFQADVRSTGEFIFRYVTNERRWLSPKFVTGESYGAARAAGLADHLQNEYGLYLNGVILISPALDYRMTSFAPQNDDPYVSYLPSYAAAAWHHGKLEPALQALPVKELAARVREYASRDYLLALHRGDELPSEELREVAGRLGQYTGIPAEYYERHQLRVPGELFLTQLLKHEGRIAGRFDARYTGLPYSSDSESWTYDPANEAILGPVSATFSEYVRHELGFVTNRVYVRYGGGTDSPAWGFGDGSWEFLNAAENLRKAMIRNPYLKVWVACGYYDFATPFFGVESTFRGLLLPAERRQNVRFTYYEAGHSFYLHGESRASLTRDLRSFMNVATRQPIVGTVRR